MLPYKVGEFVVAASKMLTRQKRSEVGNFSGVVLKASSG